MQNKKALVKMYQWNDIVRLVMRDMHARHKLGEEEIRFHYLGGLDVQGNPCVRIDILPLDKSANSC